MRRSTLATLALALFGLFLATGVTPSLGKAVLRIGRAIRHAGESPLEERRRVFSAAYADAIEAIRSTIPPDSIYILMDDDPRGGSAYMAVRFDLAPRRAVRAGSRRDLETAPSDLRWSVIALGETKAPELIDRRSGDETGVDDVP